jgi:hypothetical protein
MLQEEEEEEEEEAENKLQGESANRDRKEEMKAVMSCGETPSSLQLKNTFQRILPFDLSLLFESFLFRGPSSAGAQQCGQQPRDHAGRPPGPISRRSTNANTRATIPEVAGPALIHTVCV